MPSESDEVKHRRKMIDVASELIQKAHRAFENEDITKLFETPEYQEATRLLKAADPSSIEPLRDQLRSGLLRPSSTFDSRQSLSERIAIVEDVASRRACLLTETGRYPLVSQADITQGRILVYAPDENLCDGAAIYPSKGFLDVDNMPPWDTWVCYANRHLVSWVPPILEGLASAGIDVNPEQCIEWSTPTFVNSLINSHVR